MLPPKASVIPAFLDFFQNASYLRSENYILSSHHLWRVLSANIFGVDPAPKIIANSSSLPMLEECSFSEVLPYKSLLSLSISHSSSN